MKKVLILVFLSFFVSISWVFAGTANRRDWRRVLASPDIPLTSFSCSDRPAGYYADVEANCQVYHMCGDGGRQYSYLCPNTTLFHQRMLICAHWYQVNCSRSPDYYTANLLIGQRDRPFVEETLGSGKRVYKLEDTDKLQKLNPGSTRRGNQRSFLPVYKSEVKAENRKDDRNTKEEAVTSFESKRNSDLQQSPSGSVIPTGFRFNSPHIIATSPRSDFQSFKSPNFIRTQSSTETTVTEPVTVQFRPTNVSFRSTIETPYSDSTIPQTLPMTTSSRDSLRTESAFLKDQKFQTTNRYTVVTESSQPLLAPPPSLELLPPFEDESSEETNTIELHLEDPRRSFFIPESDGIEVPEKEIVVSIPVKSGSSRFKPTFFRKELVRECKRCHPMFVIDKKNCSPCLLIS